MCLTLSIGLAWVLSGCDTKRQAALENVHRWYEYALEERARSRYAGDLRTPYLLARYRAVLDFLAAGPRLDKPYTVWADLWFSQVDPSTSGITLEWVEYETHAVGIVLTDQAKEGIHRWHLPVFAWEKDLWVKMEGTQYYDSAGRGRRVWVLPSDDVEEPAVREAPPLEGRPPVQLLMPRRLKEANLVIGVYDEKGNVSNMVDVFVWPAEPQVTE
jgi:hypothetical protein